MGLEVWDDSLCGVVWYRTLRVKPQNQFLYGLNRKWLKFVLKWMC